jgi:membrane protein DedA with SNARE-associated domain
VWREWSSALVARHGMRAVFLARFLVGLRGFVYFALGTSRMPLGRFLTLNGAAALLNVGALVGVGFALGRAREHTAMTTAIDVCALSLLLVTFVAPVIARARAR